MNDDLVALRRIAERLAGNSKITTDERRNIGRQILLRLQTLTTPPLGQFEAVAQRRDESNA